MRNLITLGKIDRFVEKADNSVAANRVREISKALTNNKAYKDITSSKFFQSYCDLYEDISNKDDFYNGLISYCEKHLNRWPQGLNDKMLNDFTSLCEAIKDRKAVDYIVEASRLSKGVKLTEDGVGFLSVEASNIYSTNSGLSHSEYKYIPLIKDAIKNEEPLILSPQKVSTKKTRTTDLIKIDKNKFTDEELGDSYSNEEFAKKFCDVVGELEDKDGNKYLSIQKPGRENENSNDFNPSTNLQEAIQAFIISNFWTTPFSGSNGFDFVESLVNLGLMEQLDWKTVGTTEQKLRDDFDKSISDNNGRPYAGSWLAYFMLEAQTAGKKILNLFSGVNGGEIKSRLRAIPTPYARGLKGADSNVNAYFANNIAGRQKDLVNKADIVLNFDGDASSFFSNLIGKEITEYCNICDAALSNGSNLGISLKKGAGEVHAELLAGTTSINRDVFGENAATSIDYYGEDDPRNTLSLKKAILDKENLNHVVNDNNVLRFEPYQYTDKKGVAMDGKTCTISIPINKESKLYDSLNGFLVLNIRSNSEKGVTVEASGKGKKAAAGKLVEALSQVTEIKVPKGLGKIEKINFLLGMLSTVAASDYDFSLLIATTGYPLVDKSKGAENSELLMAPVIKIS